MADGFTELEEKIMAILVKERKSAAHVIADAHEIACLVTLRVSELTEKLAQVRAMFAATSTERERQLDLQVGELQRTIEVMAELGRKSMENFDDDLENRAMRHGLGALHRQWEVVLGTIEKRNEVEPRHCVKCGAQVEKGDAAHPYSCIGKGNAANPAPFHDCVGVRYCAVCNVRL